MSSTYRERESYLKEGGELRVGLLEVLYLGKGAPLVGAVLSVHFQIVRLSWNRAPHVSTGHSSERMCKEEEEGARACQLEKDLADVLG
jgi:hypothetical protein